MFIKTIFVRFNIQPLEAQNKMLTFEQIFAVYFSSFYSALTAQGVKEFY